MLVETLQYRDHGGWSVPLPEHLDSDSTAVIFFADPALRDANPLRELCAGFPNSHMIGCSTAGEIYGNELFDGSLSVAIMQLHKTRIRSSCLELSDYDNISELGFALAEALNDKDLTGIFLLSEGVHMNGTQLLEGMSRVTGNQVTITGGLAGDGNRFHSTWICGNNSVADNRVSALAFYGSDLHIGHGSQGGWDIFGPERLITKASGNVLHELDGQPALELYKKYLGERADGLPATGLLFPLSIRNEDDPQGREIVRTILSIDEENQSMSFAGDIPQGHYARLMRANMDRLIDGAANASTASVLPADLSAETPLLSIAISCVGRRLVLGERTEEEIEAVMEHLPGHARQIGFYSYGEISPRASGTCDLQNQTMTITTFCEPD